MNLRDSVSSELIRSVVTFRAFKALGQKERQWLDWITNNPIVSVNDETLQLLAGEPKPNKSIWDKNNRNEMNTAIKNLMLEETE